MWAQAYHKALIEDQAQHQFRCALGRVLRGGEAVLDLGAGTGLHSMFACQAGARVVYAVEQGPVAEVARAVAATNGFGERIRVLRRSVEDLELPEKVDLIVGHHGLSDLIALLPAAARRHLRPGGRLLPERVELFAALVDSPQAAAETVDVWSREHFGFSFASARVDALNARHRRRLSPDELIGSAHSIARIAFEGLASASFEAAFDSPSLRDGTVHGIGVWSVTTLVDELRVGGVPFAGPMEVWPHWFLPLSAPIPVSRGDAVCVSVSANPGGRPEHWNWSAGLGRNAAPRHSTILPAMRGVAPPQPGD